MNLKDTIAKVLVRTAGPDLLFSWHLHEAMKHCRNVDADLSILHFRECLKLNPGHWFSWHQFAILHLQVLGDLEEALRLFRHARRLRSRASTPQSGNNPHRFLWSMWALQIGHIANMEHLIKREMLQGRDPKNLVLLVPESLKPANQALLDKMGAYITIVRDEKKLPLPLEAMHAVLEEYYVTESIDGLTKHWWHASPEIFRAWESAGRAPLLTLTKEEARKGRACLEELGLPEGAWFACLHVRESGFKEAQGYNAIESGLNAEIASYRPAIDAILERGGRVVRVGDPKMEPLPQMPGVIDYAHCAQKSDWMDVFLLGACRFFVGTSSGPAYVPPLFGVPCVLTNWLPTGQRPFNARDIYIPKLYEAGFPSRPLSFAEAMAPPVGFAPQYAYAANLGLAAAPNTAEEIREVVIEMLDRLDGKLTYTERDEALQSAFDTVAETNLCIGNARAGRGFLQRHAKLLMGMEHHASESAAETASPVTQANVEKEKMNPSFSEGLPSDIAARSKRHVERRIENFLLDPRMVERQNIGIAKVVHSFLKQTQTIRAPDIETIARYVDEFRRIYIDSPITRNMYGMNFSGGVNLFLMTRCLAPGLIVESGVYKGQSSYYLAAACPRARIHAFDPNLAELSYRTPGVTYHPSDWMDVDVKCDPVGSGLCFFDDHQSQAQRIVQAHERGFRHVIVDDSWPIESVTGCGHPPLPSVDMVMSNPLEPGEVVHWVESEKLWTFVNTEEMRELCAHARSLIRGAYEVPSLYRESGIAPSSALKLVELV
jgi:putative glycosyltransferase (TIGR04372 family)